jgi:hypothetical protein
MYCAAVAGGTIALIVSSGCSAQTMVSNNETDAGSSGPNRSQDGGVEVADAPSMTEPATPDELDVTLNNAQLVGVRIYRTHLDWFEAWFQRYDGDVAAAVAALRQLMEGAEGDEAFARLSLSLGQAGAAPSLPASPQPLAPQP